MTSLIDPCVSDDVISNAEVTLSAGRHPSVTQCCQSNDMTSLARVRGRRWSNSAQSQQSPSRRCRSLTSVSQLPITDVEIQSGRTSSPRRLCSTSCSSRQLDDVTDMEAWPSSTPFLRHASPSLHVAPTNFVSTTAALQAFATLRGSSIPGLSVTANSTFPDTVLPLFQGVPVWTQYLHRQLSLSHHATECLRASTRQPVPASELEMDGDQLVSAGSTISFFHVGLCSTRTLSGAGTLDSLPATSPHVSLFATHTADLYKQHQNPVLSNLYQGHHRRNHRQQYNKDVDHSVPASSKLFRPYLDIVPVSSHRNSRIHDDVETGQTQTTAGTEMTTEGRLRTSTEIGHCSQQRTTNCHVSAQRKYYCDLCGRLFSRSNTLVTHRRIHTGEKPFSCDLCGRAFRQPGNLTRHRLTHTAIRPFVCDVCHKAFNRASNLQTHLRVHAARQHPPSTVNNK